MHVKRMNWEKIENVDDNMIWSKVSAHSLYHLSEYYPFFLIFSRIVQNKCWILKCKNNVKDTPN